MKSVRTTKLLLGLALSACGGQPAPAPEVATTNPPPAPGPVESPAPPRADAAPEEPAPAPAPADTGTTATPKSGYPPPPIPPLHARSAQPGDGEWTPLGGAGDRAGEGTPVFHETILHPHPSSRFITLTVVAIDLASVSLHFMPGTEDVGSTKLPVAPGLVPAEERDRVLAVFNGGFQPRHGRWGMRLGESTVVPPRDIGCTIALEADGNVRIRSFPSIAERVSSLRALRQTPPCLVEQGVVHPDLIAGRDKIWAGQTPGLVTRRRSAIGIDASGRVLFYAIGVETTPRLLAEGLRAAGAQDAAELDINWNWTRFLLFGTDANGALRVSTSLVEGEYAKSGYVSRPSERDFFYLLRR